MPINLSAFSQITFISHQIVYSISTTPQFDRIPSNGLPKKNIFNGQWTQKIIYTYKCKTSTQISDKMTAMTVTMCFSKLLPLSSLMIAQKTSYLLVRLLSNMFVDSNWSAIPLNDVVITFYAACMGFDKKEHRVHHHFAT